MSGFLRDVRHAIRLLLRQRGFTAVALLSLALGIGATSALFSIFNTLLWKPLPVSDPDALVVLYRKADTQSFYDAFSYPEYRDYRDHAGVFRGLAGYTPMEFAARMDGSEATRVFGEMVTDDYFDVLGLRFTLGRGFDASAGTAAPAVVLEHDYWASRFDADPGVLGRTITLNDVSFTIVGVAPKDFRGAYAVYFKPAIWVPASSLPQLRRQPGILENRSATLFRLIGRLNPGVNAKQAEAACAPIAARLAESFPATNTGMKTFVFPELATRPEVEIGDQSRATAAIFLALTSLVLLIACANVANLLLSRAAARQKEIAIRLAIGSSRRQLVSQLLVEAFVLAVASGLAALGLTALAMRAASSYRVSTDLPLVLSFSIDFRVVVVTMSLSVVAALLFGLLPALRQTRGDLVPALKNDTPIAGRHRRVGLTGLLVIGQVAASLVLLIVAGLFVRSIGGARDMDPGFQTDERFVMALSPRLRNYETTVTETFYRRLLEDVRALPTVSSATLAQYVPLDFSIDGGDIVAEGRPAPPGKESYQTFSGVADEFYFETLGTRILSGRAFTSADTADSRKVAMVNGTLARALWPNEEPIGRRLRFAGGDADDWIEVVGVIADGKYRQLIEDPRPYLLVPRSQHYRDTMTLVVKASRGVDAAIADARRAVAALDPAMPVSDVRTMEQFMERSYMAPRMAALLTIPAGLAALIIAVVGLYGVIAYWVSQRTREIGIRVAIGAAPSDIRSLVLGQGLVLAGAGLAVGLAAAWAAARLVAGMLFGVSASDPIVFLTVPILIVAVTAAASYLPARRALRVDPLTALRQQ